MAILVRHTPASRRVLAVALTVMALLWAVPASAFTVVIDPGHGGNDVGAKGERIYEKDINLAVAKRLGKLIEKKMKDAKVVYTRDTDVFIPLQRRCDVANRAKGDIFVSVHTNSVAANAANRKSVNGASVYTLGLNRAGTNLDVAMRENAVMKLEDDYTTTYSGFDPNSAESYIVFELTQSSHIDQSLRLAKEIQNQLTSTAGRRDLGVRQAPFWVLVRTSMPAVLVELDFVCNPQVEAFLGSDNGRDNLAEAIFSGIERYRSCIPADNPKPKADTPRPAKEKKSKKNKHKNKKTAEPAPDATPQPAVEPSDDSTIIYKVQFLTNVRSIKAGDPRFRGLDNVESYTDGGVVKFTVGADTDLNAAKQRLRSVRTLFPDAFIITTQGGKRIR